MTHEIAFEMRGETITLGDLLKATGTAPSGGGAKALIVGGQVQVDGQVELRRGCKLRAGQIATLRGTRIRLVAKAAGPQEDVGR
ncbi:MAG: RNA-binding S4 domain-containing protein [Casimicrobiaceae bacterium]